MQILLYNELDSRKIPSFAKLKQFLEADDFRSAEVKKVGDNLYRAKLDRSHRLLFAIHRYQGEAYALVLECIEHHAYEKSRFLSRGVTIDEARIPLVKTLQEVPEEPLVFLNPQAKRFNLLDKVISFDHSQQAVYALQPPLIVIGSAGSGKTALTLEKMKEAVGDVLYVTQSSYLVSSLFRSFLRAFICLPERKRRSLILIAGLAGGVRQVASVTATNCLRNSRACSPAPSPTRPG